ncbi:hypothetical protein BCR33DRAFT_852696 [Rhizoclosmatium globosum]|uniref:RRM domain-containing protein n=1 Tax=Rhizoclosmatium globosum TaxID=329046 RepID=A0A1Y2C0B7_9FUNG|nr:hypothetical protein HDU99_002918 [Rhizoclosmatium hyalinum]KAJ3296214.1 hypothetical protein HDU79_007303 [Rhizoclosmatium sp. JEL0117]ORY40354.1 hypothetical protein BCR33DRAFT_852696 [Rhizoclosmatium globosum]|eukprot:ORY40354.1 hypothetical protein BCR33DRAFT_852696 [Rhizoclosmatium globosum]
MSLVFRRLFSSSSSVFEKKNLFVGNLSWTVKSADLATLFSQYGPVESARVVSDRETGRSRGFAFVEMEEAEANAAVEKLNGTEFQGRELRVNVAEPRESRPQGDRPPRREGGFKPREGGFQRREGGNNNGGFQRGPRRDGPPSGGNRDRY